MSLLPIGNDTMVNIKHITHLTVEKDFEGFYKLVVHFTSGKEIICMQDTDKGKVLNYQDVLTRNIYRM